MLIRWIQYEWAELCDRFAIALDDYRNRNVCGFDLVTAIPPARSLTPRTISRQKDRRKS